MTTQARRALRLQLVRLLLALGCLIGTSGCSLCRIQYRPLLNKNVKIQAVAQARVIDGYGERAQELASQVRLPHNSKKQGFALWVKAKHELTGQLGSHDYRIIGEISGGGNGNTSMGRLKEKMAKKAAKEGGDVVLVLEQGVDERDVAYSTPGYATTNVYGRTAYTRYHPGTTYGRRLYLPHAAGLVLKYSPGLDAIGLKLLSLDDEAFGEFIARWMVIETEETDYTRLELRHRELVNSLVPATQPGMPETDTIRQPAPAGRQAARMPPARMPRIIESQIESDFEGFDHGKIFKLVNGQVWEQTEFYIEIHIAVMPSATILEIDGTYKMKVDGIDHAVAVQPLNMAPEPAAVQADVHVSANANPDIDQLRQMLVAGTARLFASDGQFLGTVDGEYETDSIGNQYGDYGSKYSDKSICNPYGDYGGRYSDKSPYNPYTDGPPMLMINGRAVAFVTVNKLLSPRVHPDILLLLARGE